MATRRTLNPFYGIFSNFEGIKLVHRHLNYAYSEFLSILNAYRFSIFIRIFLGNPFYMITHNFFYVFRPFPKVLAFTCLLQKHSSCLFNKSHVPRNGKKKCYGFILRMSIRDDQQWQLNASVDTLERKTWLIRGEGGWGKGWRGQMYPDVKCRLDLSVRLSFFFSYLFLWPTKR